MARTKGLASALVIAGTVAAIAATPVTAMAATHHAAKTHKSAATKSAKQARAQRTARMRANPQSNVAPSPGYDSCWSAPSSDGCIQQELAAIDNARAREGVKAMVLPDGYAAMTAAEQTFVVTNLERVDRGLRPFAGLVSPLVKQSKTAARNDEDPELASWDFDHMSGYKATSNWAGDVNALGADYDWMYNDGHSTHGYTSNQDCGSASASGCWGHRENILATYGGLPLLVAGVAEEQQKDYQSTAELMVGATGHKPNYIFTWHEALHSNADNG